MALADEATIHRKSGNIAREREMLGLAYRAEFDAAMLMITSFDIEPTRSVLFRSAAALALDAGLHREAERMIGFGLGGSPPEAIAEELRDLLEEANFARHLELRGVELLPNEIQIAIWNGSVVGSGIIGSNEFTDRVNRITQLGARTIARKKGQPFDERLPRRKNSQRDLQTYVSASRRGSFAFTIRFGTSPQLGIFDGDSNVDIVREMVELFNLVNTSNLEELEKRIPDEAYRRNFIAQSKELAPDGKRVKSVGITARNSHDLVRVRLEPRSRLLSTPSKPDLHKGEDLGKKVKFTGELKVADAYRKNSIAIIEDNNKRINVNVPKGMLNDIVRPYFGEQVMVIAKKVRAGFELIEISTENEE